MRNFTKFKLLLAAFSFLGIQLPLLAQAPLTYDFGTGTGSHTSGESTSFLPASASGTVKVRVGTAGGGIYMENPGDSLFGSGSELRINAPSSTSINKFTHYDYTGNFMTYLKFSIVLKAGNTQGGELYLLTGNGNSFSGNSGFSTAETFTGLKFVLSTSGPDVTLTYRNSTLWTAFTTLQKNTIYEFEVWGNNNTTSEFYNRCDSNYTVPQGKQDIWMNGSLLGNDLGIGGLINGSLIDSWMFYAQSSALNALNVHLDDISYSNFWPSFPAAGFDFTEPTCNGYNNGAINLNVYNAVLPLSYVWSTGDTIEDISGLVSGSYSVTITEGNGCIANVMDFLYEPAVVGIDSGASFVNNVTCFGGTNGSASYPLMGGTPPYVYQWSNGEDSVVAAGLSAGYYNVVLNDANGCSGLSVDSIFIGQPASPPGTPINRRTTDIQNVSAIARWNIVPGADIYRVRYRQAGVQTWSGYLSTSNNYRKFVGLNPGTNYEWSVRAICGGIAYSNFSAPVAFSTLVLACDTPTAPMWSDVTAGSVRFSWMAPDSGSAPHHYVVVYGPDGFPWPNTPGMNAGGNNIDAFGLMASTTYKWRVRTACDSTGKAASEWVIGPIFTTAAAKTLSIEKLNQVSKVSFYPNPANDVLNIELTEIPINTIIISDIQGKALYTQHGGLESDDKFWIDISGFSEGIYFIKVQTGNSVQSGKFNIAR